MCGLHEEGEREACGDGVGAVGDFARGVRARGGAVMAKKKGKKVVRRRPARKRLDDQTLVLARVLDHVELLENRIEALEAAARGADEEEDDDNVLDLRG